MRSGLIRPGDIAVMTLGLVGTGFAAWHAWGAPSAQKLTIRSGGVVVVETTLQQRRDFQISGPLGETIVAVEPGRARIKRDPSPRQYCVKQGWLSRAGESAICLPNRVSIELVASKPVYDSLNY